MEEIHAKRARFIRLGGSGDWASACIENGTIRMGFNEAVHKICLKGDWDAIKKIFLDMGKASYVASNIRNQLREFYEANQEVLWITFHANRLWWCFSEPKVTLLSDGTRIRPTVDGWHDEDIQGQRLNLLSLKGSLAAMQGFQGASCNVREFQYLIHKINGQESPEIRAALKARNILNERIGDIIRHLQPDVFELLIDLVFRQAGWRRIGELGGKQEIIDLAVFSPLTQEKYAIQVKSQASRAEFERYRGMFEDMDGYARFYFVVHSPSKDLKKELEDAENKIVLLDEIAQWTIEYGLEDWVISKAG